MTPIEIQDKYGLLPAEFPIWSAIVIRIYHTWDDLLKARSSMLKCGEWMAIFGESDSFPVAVCRADEGFQPSTSNSILRIPRKIQLFTVKQVSKTLEVIPEEMPKFPIIWDERGDDTVQLCHGKVCRVRVVEVIKGPKKSPIWLYYGLISKLEWDPGQMYWPDFKEFLKYTSKQGRELLQRQVKIPNVVEQKWSGVLPNNYKL